jgi:hypothetical protein
MTHHQPGFWTRFDLKRKTAFVFSGNGNNRWLQPEMIPARGLAVDLYKGVGVLQANRM